MRQLLGVLHKLIDLLGFEPVDEFVQLVVITHGGHAEIVRVPGDRVAEADRILVIRETRGGTAQRSGRAAGLDPAVQGGLGGAGVQGLVGAGDAGGDALGYRGQLAGLDV